MNLSICCARTRSSRPLNTHIGSLVPASMNLVLICVWRNTTACHERDRMERVPNRR